MDPKTGQRKTAEQIKADQAKMKQEAARVAKQRANKEKLEAKRPWYDKFGFFGGASAQIKKAQVASTKPKPKPIAPSTKPKPKVTVVQGAKTKSQLVGSSSSTKTPKFSASNPRASSSSAQVKGIRK